MGSWPPLSTPVYVPYVRPQCSTDLDRIWRAACNLRMVMGVIFAEKPRDAPSSFRMPRVKVDKSSSWTAVAAAISLAWPSGLTQQYFFVYERADCTINALTFSTTCCSHGQLLEVLYHNLAEAPSAWSYKRQCIVCGAQWGICPIGRQQQRRPVGLLLSALPAGDIDRQLRALWRRRRRSAANAGSIIRLLSEEAQHRLVSVRHILRVFAFNVTNYRYCR